MADMVADVANELVVVESASTRRNGRSRRSSLRPAEVRCPHCGRLLFVALLQPGSHVEIRCTRSGCRRMVVLDEPVLTQNKVSDNMKLIKSDRESPARAPFERQST